MLLTTRSLPGSLSNAKPCSTRSPCTCHQPNASLPARSPVHHSATPHRGRGSVARAQASRVTVSVEKTERNTRNCFACIYIAVPIHIVWGALTDYDNLGTFIPGLAENRCLSRHPTGAQILQVGEQNVALGARFKAKVVLDCQEFMSGLPPEVHVPMGDGRVIPQPRAPVATAAQDIMFHLVEGDFQVFQGVWRMQPEAAGGAGTWLSYALHVKPPPWMPVRLIQGRIESEIASNLQAVQAYSDRLWAAQTAEVGV